MHPSYHNNVVSIPYAYTGGFGNTEDLTNSSFNFSSSGETPLYMSPPHFNMGFNLSIFHCWVIINDL